MTRFVCLMMLCGLFCAGAGCGPNSGEGIPKLFPVTVTVTTGGQPLADISVNLAGAEGLSIGGTTDATGKAVLSTRRSSFVEEGAPQGEYKVTLSESGPKVRSLSIAERESMSKAELAAYEKEVENANKGWKPQIPKTLTTFDKTPLSVSVTNSADNALTVDVKEYAQ